MIGIRRLGDDGTAGVSKQKHVTKAVAQHGWYNLKDWVSALDELADLTDEQIDRVAERAHNHASPCKPHPK